jgi:hypothetical protein
MHWLRHLSRRLEVFQACMCARVCATLQQQNTKQQTKNKKQET